MASSESVPDVTAVGAIFSVSVPIGGECLSASGTDKGVNRLAVDPVGVFRPPLLAASFAAEYPPFRFLPLYEGLAALPASVCSIGGSAVRNHQTVPAAEALDGIPGNSKFPPYVGISESLSAEADDFLFLFVGHENHLLQVAHENAKS